MARIARVIAPGLPHHVTQRGNRRQKTFFIDADYQEYLHLMSEWCNRCKVEVWSYCLMPNHIHLIAAPKSVDGLRKAIGEAHRRFTRYVNFREGWKGHLWQGRFASFPMDEHYVVAAVRYVVLNPVRAKFVRQAEDYPWSSAAALLSGKNDILATVAPLIAIIGDWKDLLSPPSDDEMAAIRDHERTGRPLGDDNFISILEETTGRLLKIQKPGPKKKILSPRETQQSCQGILL